MQREFHYERFVKEKITKKKKRMIILLFAIMLFAMLFSGFVIGIFFGLPFVGVGAICAIAWGFYVYLTKVAVEYEYTLTGTTSAVYLDVAKILGGKKRKEFLSIDCKEAEIVARVNGSKDNDALRRIPICYKCVRTMEEDDLFFIISNTEVGRAIIYVQLNEDMLAALKGSIPSKVFVA